MKAIRLNEIYIMQKIYALDIFFVLFEIIFIHIYLINFQNQEKIKRWKSWLYNGGKVFVYGGGIVRRREKEQKEIK